MTLRVTVELIPGGQERFIRTLARAEISNVGGSAWVGDYEFTVGEEDNDLTAVRAWTDTGRIEKHSRATSVWLLVAKVAMWAHRRSQED
ncbi:hypothetical protein ACT4MK_26350 [Bradyrhizobium barranii]|uniref:Uncharacterized protein n=1 Tax=Bradyrhizobium barranii subsp. barranii TaxID=2823807 RepID=A0A7Z0Q431_9BRAD|nr:MULTISPECIES: hypothetical protein [Bradyrhizobium]UGX96437.1 hypothetical protein G6321_00015350 [Bradyrhizobium barranii subsp. barranii]